MEYWDVSEEGMVSERVKWKTGGSGRKMECSDGEGTYWMGEQRRVGEFNNKGTSKNMSFRRDGNSEAIEEGRKVV